MISEEEKIWLDREITLEEIEFALSNSANEKAPGPDGFNIGCIKTFWNYLKTDLLNCYKDFSESLPFPAGLNSSFISLIPKKDSPEYVTDFRPISLINSTAKLFTKVLALRLGEVLGNIDSKISECISGILEVNNLEMMKGSLDIFNFKWQIGNGEQVLFWEDYWFSQGTLKSLFPRLYKISNFQCTNIRAFKDLLDCYEAYGEVFWKRKLRSWEQEQVDSILGICSNICLKRCIDKLIWLPVDGSYTAANSYEFLAKESDDTKVEWNFIWKYRIPPKVQIVLWKFFKKILPTSSFLAGRIGPRFAGSRVCKWCNRDEETQMHLFWKCEVAQWAWNFVSTWWKIKIKSGDAGKSSLNFKGPSTQMAWEIT
ncbi:hypothetical protein POM88_045659 [Heracleum sosnowskyi]|uniref:Reverse transcriptase zinc-binding domain-containing protein n=1 Tax=Heracleum sosnowskyi TaxID=360622 RepID=A0AAD8M413_9APIA|nr:hypothetical protein POM88_045659 [Heracleum sosnowskyi]